MRRRGGDDVFLSELLIRGVERERADGEDTVSSCRGIYLLVKSRTECNSSAGVQETASCARYQHARRCSR